ncbi:MAG: aspartate kinase [Candidatus Lokiarchaeota archaeon]|nr:aspartate kinase [Candidatus Lokiarchaeota archaeon]
MTIVIMKFGGSCLQNNEAFGKILDITNIYKDSKKIYVASALQGITDILLKTAHNVVDKKEIDKNIALIEKKHLDVIEEIFNQDTEYYTNSKDWLDKKLSELEDCIVDIEEFGLEPYYIDYISSFGEILSTYILSQYLESKKINSIFISANSLIITNDNFNNAYPLYELTNARIKNHLVPLLENPKENTLICVTGFIGRNKIGYTTTLGRGGSDYTATILARSIYDECADKDIKIILWKDVDGLLSINPKYVSESFLIRNLDYIEAKQIANFGAKVLHPKCLEAIEERKIPLEIRNFNKPLEKEKFTIISNKTNKDQIKGISAIEDAIVITIISGSMVDIPGVLGKIFDVMGKNKISVSFVAQSSSEISTSFVVNGEDSEKAIKALKSEEFFSEFYHINWEPVSIINITGLKVLDNKTKSDIFNALAKKNVNVKGISQSNDELNLSLLVKKEKLMDGINIVHDDLCEEFENNNCTN